MHGISFHIYKNQNRNTWTLAYTTNGRRHTSEYHTKDDAMQASYSMAASAVD